MTATTASSPYPPWSCFSPSAVPPGPGEAPVAARNSLTHSAALCTLVPAATGMKALPGVTSHRLISSTGRAMSSALSRLILRGEMTPPRPPRPAPSRSGSRTHPDGLAYPARRTSRAVGPGKLARSDGRRGGMSSSRTITSRTSLLRGGCCCWS
ncbi:hypothetical protein VTG60DRAFT_4947 [Thermothelomyces hinnuleus]